MRTDTYAVPRSARTVVASGVIWLNVVADPCPNVNGAEVVTDPAFVEDTTAISCLGVPGSTTIVDPVPNAVPPEATVIVDPPMVVAAFAVPYGETWVNPAVA